MPQLQCATAAVARGASSQLRPQLRAGAAAESQSDVRLPRSCWPGAQRFCDGAHRPGAAPRRAHDSGVHRGANRYTHAEWTRRLPVEYTHSVIMRFVFCEDEAFGFPLDLRSPCALHRCPADHFPGHRRRFKLHSRQYPHHS